MSLHTSPHLTTSEDHINPITAQVGTDANSQLLKDSLNKCGVDLSYLREIEGPSGTAMIMVDPSGSLLAVLW